MQSYSIGPLTGQLKPKYKSIKIAIGEDYVPTSGVDIYIDLGSLLRSMTSSRKFMNSLPFAENVQTDIVSNILLTFKHWKDFTNRWSNTRIIMMVNDLEPSNMAEQSVLKSYMKPFKHKYEDDRLRQLVYYWTESLKTVEVVLRYIPNGYLVKCNRFDSYVLPELISDKRRDRIIVTSDPFLTSHFYMNNTKVIYTRFGQYGMSQISDPQMLVHAVSHIDDEIVGTFIKNKVFYNTLQLFIGSKDRAIQGIQPLGVTAYASDLIRGVEQRKIPNNPTSVESILPVINPNYHEYVTKTYPLIDIPSHAQLVSLSMIEKTKSNMVDLLDIDGLSQLSIEGLNLLELM
jgi:hypothetical protein